MGTTGLAWLTSEALAISKAYRETIHSFQEAMTSKPCEGRSSSLWKILLLNLLIGLKTTVFVF